MKTHVDFLQVVALPAEQLLALSRHKYVDTTWLEWCEVRHVQDALDSFQEKGWVHSTLRRTVEQLGVYTLTGILGDLYDMEVTDKKKTNGISWEVTLTSEDGAVQVFEDTELCDALWTAVKNELEKGQFSLWEKV